MLRNPSVLSHVADRAIALVDWVINSSLNSNVHDTNVQDKQIHTCTGDRQTDRHNVTRRNYTLNLFTGKLEETVCVI